MNKKVHPLTFHKDSERKQMYSSTFSSSWRLSGIGGQGHAPAALPLGKKLGTYFTGGWVGLRAALNGCGKSRHYQDSIPLPPRP
jgi:hypothetical protein